QVIQVMVEASVEGVLVVDGLGRVVGLIGDEQLVREANVSDTRPWRLHFGARHVPPDERLLDLDAGEVMLTRVVPVSPDLSFASALRLFDDYAVNVLPVVDDGRLVGALFRCDLVKQFFFALRGTVEAET